MKTPTAVVLELYATFDRGDFDRLQALMHIDRVVDGKVVAHWGQGDQAGMMQQLGIIFVPGIGLFSSALGHRLRTKRSELG